MTDQNRAFLVKNDVQSNLTEGVVTLLRDKDNLSDKPAVYQCLADYFQGLAGGAPAGAAADKFPNTEGMSEEAAIEAIQAFEALQKQKVKEAEAAKEQAEKLLMEVRDNGVLESAKKALSKKNYKGRALPLEVNETYTLEEMWASEMGSPFIPRATDNDYVCHWADKDMDYNFDNSSDDYPGWVNEKFEHLDPNDWQSRIKCVATTPDQEKILKDTAFDHQLMNP